MRLIPAPTVDQQTVFAACINSIANADLRGRLEAITDDFIASARGYSARGLAQQLYLIPAVNLEDNATVVGNVTKLELTSTYSQHMVGKTKPARVFYDQLMLSAPLRICPFCGIGHASTLDHYLPKAKFPLLSVVTLNLVPSCKDCNTGKNADIASTEAEQTLHPYFEQRAVIENQWLYARLNEEAPASLEFYTDAPAHWPEVLRSRVTAHFNSYKLAARYSIQASNGLATLRNTLEFLWEIHGAAGVELHLQAAVAGHTRQHRNAWDTAMYQALAASPWYCGGGFREF
ncbi:HNH endonuclease [Pseudomonas aeruginosa]